MIEFFRAIPDNRFLLPSLLAGLLASAACGVVGPYVITRRIVFLSGAIAHMAVGGIGLVVWLKWYSPEPLAWLHPIHGAVIAALLGAVSIGLVHQRIEERIDTMIGAMWAIGMALGIMLVKFTPGYQNDLMSYLFGKISLVGYGDVILLACLSGVILLTVALLHKRLLAVCIDQEQCELQGVNVLTTNIILLCLVALTAICLTYVVGLILMIALLCLPAATAAHHVGRMTSMMIVAVVLCALLTTLPRMVVYGTRISPEAAIVLSAAGLYLFSVLAGRVWKTRTA